MKLDVSQIQGYSEMTAEQKLKALEEYEIPEPDFSGYVKKELFDKTASELSKKTKELRQKMSDDEAQKLKEQEEKEEITEKYNKLLRETEIEKNKSKLIAMGYEEKLASDTAEAIIDGNYEKVIANQKKHLDAYAKTVRSKALDDTPKPTPDGEGKTMTLEKLRKMTSDERYNFSVEHPDEYKELYGGNK